MPDDAVDGGVYDSRLVVVSGIRCGDAAVTVATERVVVPLPFAHHTWRMADDGPALMTSPVTSAWHAWSDA
eukprot:scaffold4750_cov140-Isochrysis_galbana.AAC.15